MLQSDGTQHKSVKRDTFSEIGKLISPGYMICGIGGKRIEENSEETPRREWRPQAIRKGKRTQICIYLTSYYRAEWLTLLVYW